MNKISNSSSLKTNSLNSDQISQNGELESVDYGAQNINLYLAALFAPDTYGGNGYPSLLREPSIPKVIDLSATDTWGANDTTWMIALVPDASPNNQVQIWKAGTNGVLGYAYAIPWNDDWSNSNNYTYFRRVGMRVTFAASTITMANFNLSGTINGTVFKDAPLFWSLNYANVIKYSATHKSVVKGIGITEGVTLLAEPGNSPDWIATTAYPTNNQMLIPITTPSGSSYTYTLAYTYWGTIALRGYVGTTASTANVIVTAYSFVYNSGTGTSSEVSVASRSFLSSATYQGVCDLLFSTDYPISKIVIS